FPHQSTASDLNYHATRKARKHPTILELGSKFCNLVHDSNIALVPDNDEECKTHIKIVTELMEAEALVWGLNSVPFLADGKWGYRWGHLAKADKDGIKTKDPKNVQLWNDEYKRWHGKELAA
ncbi:MAG: hypothetical protein AB7V39_22375, partial [Nitrospiraceae bacterium]